MSLVPKIGALAPLLTEPVVIFGKSTVPVGTAAVLGASVRRLAPAEDGVGMARNTEFLREGFGGAGHLASRPNGAGIGP